MRPYTVFLSISLLLCFNGFLRGDEQKSNPPMTYLVVIDVSGSMKGPLPVPLQAELSKSSKLAEVKRRLSMLAQYLPEKTHVIVTTFDTKVTAVCDLKLTSDVERNALTSAFESIQCTEGSTFLWRTADAQLKRAAEIAQSNPDGRVRVLLYTDGEDMEKAAGLDHNTIIRKYGNSLKSVVELDWVTLGYDLQTDVKSALQNQGVNFTAAMDPSDIVPLRAAFRLSKVSVQPGEMVQLTDESMGVELTQFTVDWGDGTAPENVPPFQHAYQRPGRMTVKYTIVSKQGKTATAEHAIEVTQPAAPVAMMEVSHDQLMVGEALNAKDLTTPGAVNREWFFNGRKISIESTVTITPQEPGTGKLLLRVTDLFGQTSEATREIRVEKPTPPVAQIAIPKTAVLPEEPVHVVDVSAGKIASRRWKCEGLQDQQSQAAEFRFKQPGTYTISLSVTDADGQTAGTSCVVTVELPTKPTAAFRFSADSATPGESVTLINESSASAVRFEWTVDSHTFSDRHVVLPISEYGDVVVQLQVWDKFEQADSMKSILKVPRPPKPTASFELPASIPPGTVVTLIDNSSGVIKGPGQWLVNDEPAAEGLTYEFHADHPGQFEVCRVVTGPGGKAECRKSIDVSAWPVPQAGFTIGSRNPRSGDRILITDTSSGTADNVTFHIDGEESPIITRLNGVVQQSSFELDCDRVGTINIEQTISGPGGTTSLRDSVTVATRYLPLVAKCAVNVTSGRGPTEVQFRNESTGSIKEILFDSGDGSPKKNVTGLPLFTHVYAPGSYTPRLVVQGQDGEASATWALEHPIVIARPVPQWIKKLAWQFPAGLLSCWGLFALVGRRKVALLERQRRLLSGHLLIREASKPGSTRHIDFHGVSSEEAVALDPDTTLKLTTQADEWDVRYIAELISDGASVAQAELEEGAEQNLDGLLVSYTP